MKSLLSLAAHDYSTALCRMEDATATLAEHGLGEPARVEALRRALGVVRLLAEGIVGTSAGGIASEPPPSRVKGSAIDADAPSAEDHEPFADYMEHPYAYQAACHECDWRGPMFYVMETPDAKYRAREAAHRLHGNTGDVERAGQPEETRLDSGASSSTLGSARERQPRPLSDFAATEVLRP